MGLKLVRMDDPNFGTGNHSNTNAVMQSLEGDEVLRL